MLRCFSTVTKMASKILDADIDPSGVFKYILIKITAKDQNESIAKEIVRGYAECPYHCKFIILFIL